MLYTYNSIPPEEEVMNLKEGREGDMGGRRKGGRGRRDVSIVSVYEIFKKK